MNKCKHVFFVGILRLKNMTDAFPLTLSVRSILFDGTIHQQTTTAHTVQGIVQIIRSTPGMGVKIVTSNGVAIYPPGFSVSGLRSRLHLPDTLTGPRL